MALPVLNTNETVILTIPLSDYKDLVYCVETVNKKREYQQQYYQKHKENKNINANKGQKLMPKINMQYLLLHSPP
jgi:hypothetical protein